MSATVNLKLWKYRAKKDGLFPIYIRITKNRKSTWQSTDIAVRVRDWDDAKGKIKPSHPNSESYNKLLRKLELRYQSDVSDMESNELNLGIKAIKRKLNGQDATNFTLTARELANNYKMRAKLVRMPK